MVKNKAPIGLHVPDGRWDAMEDAPYIEAFFLDENEQLVPTGKDWLRDTCAE